MRLKPSFSKTCVSCRRGDGFLSFEENALAKKAELNYLTAFLKGRKVVKTQFGRDASDGLATFRNNRACAQNLTSSLICKLQYKVEVSRAKVEKLNVFCRAIFREWDRGGVKTIVWCRRNKHFRSDLDFDLQNTGQKCKTL